LAADERSELTHLFEKEHVRQLATMLRSRKDNAPVDMLDAAYWKKGCSSLGKLRYCVLLGVGKKQLELCLMDLKEAVQAAALVDESADMPEDQAERVGGRASFVTPFGRTDARHSIFRPINLYARASTAGFEDRARDAYA
jgi:uncharacterized protein (DUF2252 family)